MKDPESGSTFVMGRTMAGSKFGKYSSTDTSSYVLLQLGRSRDWRRKSQGRGKESGIGYGEQFGDRVRCNEEPSQTGHFFSEVTFV